MILLLPQPILGCEPAVLNSVGVENGSWGLDLLFPVFDSVMVNFSTLFISFTAIDASSSSLVLSGWCRGFSVEVSNHAWGVFLLVKPHFKIEIL